MLATLRSWAALVKRDVLALYLAARDARTPWAARIIAAAVAAYALSPIDLIPDFIPVVGYLDDLILVPLGIVVAVKLVPPPLMAEFRERANRIGRPASVVGAVVIVVLWLILVALCAVWIWSASSLINRG